MQVQESNASTAGTAPSLRVLVAVIAYNEAANLEPVISDLREHCDYDLVVVDNGSTDDTAALARRLGVPCVSHCTNSGNSMGTVKTYFCYAWQHGYDVLCQFDGDGQHDAAYLEEIIRPIAEDRADYVIGSRFIEAEGFQSSFLRRIGINLFSGLASRIVGQNITDITSGFRAYASPVIELFGRKYKHELYDTSQLLLLAHYAGARIFETPVRMRERMSGSSEYNFVKASGFPFVAILNVVACMMQRRQIKQLRES